MTWPLHTERLPPGVPGSHGGTAHSRTHAGSSSRLTSKPESRSPPVPPGPLAHKWLGHGLESCPSTKRALFLAPAGGIPLCHTNLSVRPPSLSHSFQPISQQLHAGPSMPPAGLTVSAAPPQDGWESSLLPAPLFCCHLTKADTHSPFPGSCGHGPGCRDVETHQCPLLQPGMGPTPHCDWALGAAQSLVNYLSPVSALHTAPFSSLTCSQQQAFGPRPLL